jgi:hypothetical protein
MTIASKRRAAAPALAVLLALLVAAPAGAGRMWCRVDPVFLVAGTRVSVLVAVPEAAQAGVTGPLEVRLLVPVGTDATLESVDAGFNGHGEDAAIVPAEHLKHDRRVAIQAEVTVPAAGDDFSVEVTVIPAQGKTRTVSGRSNLPVLVRSSVVPAG